MNNSKIKYFNSNFQFPKLTDSIVFTNGCFDLLHFGHLKILEQAKSKGDILVVGINSNESVKKLKGESRPINDEYFRAYLLSLFQMVDYVIIFNEETPLRLIETINPSIIVKGGDYLEEDVVGYDYIKKYGGKVVIVPTIPGLSTTTLVSEISKKNNQHFY